MALLDRLRAQRETASTTLTALTDRYDTDDTSEFSDADRSNFDALVSEISTLDGRIAELAEIEAANMKHAATLGKLVPEQRTRLEVRDRPTSFAESFVKSAELAAYRQAGFNGTSSAHVAEFALVKSVDTDGLAISGSQHVRDAATATVRTPVLDSIAKEVCSSNSTYYIEWPEMPPEAGAVAEGAPAGEASYPPVVKEVQLGKFAHTIPVTEEGLADEARLESILKGALVDGVRLKAEKAATAAILAQLASYTDVKHATGLLQAIRVGIAKVQDKGWNPSTVYINSEDLAGIDIELLTATLAGAQRNTSPWQIDYVATPGITAGTALVADSRAAFLLLERQQIETSITDSHADEFVSGIHRIKATSRGLIVVQRAGAVAKCSKGTATR